MTEEEAKNFPCIGPEQCGRTGARSTIRYCVGSICRMAWRWSDIAYEWRRGRENPEGDGWEHPVGELDLWARALPPIKGYCGLAGKP